MEAGHRGTTTGISKETHPTSVGKTSLADRLPSSRFPAWITNAEYPHIQECVSARFYVWASNFYKIG